jgi:hypothetical protein
LPPATFSATAYSCTMPLLLLTALPLKVRVMVVPTSVQAPPSVRLRYCSFQSPVP